MREELQRFLKAYPKSPNHRFTKDSEAMRAARAMRAAVKDAYGKIRPTFSIKVSVGMGGWADTPLIAMMDPLVTTSTQRGYYVAYLFVPTQGRLVLALAQGVTEQRRAYRAKEARKRLNEIAALLRSKAPGFDKRFRGSHFDLDPRKATSRTSFYQFSIAFGIKYRLPLPQEDVLVADLREMSRLYSLITFNGGPDLTGEGVPVEEGVQEGPTPGETVLRSGVEDPRRVRLHYQIERNPKLARDAKKAHGSTCQACGFNFDQFYGDASKGYIEAHHLQPLSELPKDAPALLDPQKDFAVLCANCHRVIHRSRPLMPLVELQQLVRTKAQSGYCLPRPQEQTKTPGVSRSSVSA